MDRNNRTRVKNYEKSLSKISVLKSNNKRTRGRRKWTETIEHEMTEEEEEED